MAESNAAPSRWIASRSAARRAAPWAIAAAILWFLFDRVPLADAWAAAAEARLLEFALVHGARGDRLVAARIRARSPTCSLASTHRSMERSAFAARPHLPRHTGELEPRHRRVVLHLRRSKGISAVQSTSTMIFYGLVDSWCFRRLALAGASALPASPETGSIQRAPRGADAFAIANLAVFMTSRPRWAWLARIRGAGIFSTHRIATVRDLAVLVAVRTCYFGGFVLYFWFGTQAFHTAVPLPMALAATPIVLVVASLPITPAGLARRRPRCSTCSRRTDPPAAILASRWPTPSR
jgi:hypothetical protein